MKTREQLELEQATADIIREKEVSAEADKTISSDKITQKSVSSSGVWITSQPSSQAFLMAEKKESRFKKGKVFTGFVLARTSLEFKDDEFAQFLNLLKTNIDEIPSGTRISLTVVTSFVDIATDLEGFTQIEIEDFLNGFQPYHWNAVELLIKDNQVYSFTLDASNSVGYTKMHADLKREFPEGDHYVYISDSITLPERTKPLVRQIQFSRIGCETFSITQLKQLSQIDSHRLFFQELPKLAFDSRLKGKSEGSVYPGNFQGGEKLLRIFRGIQSWCSFSSFPEAVKNTVVKEEKKMTLGELVKEAFDQGKEAGSLIIFNKSRKYMKEKAVYFAHIDEEMRLSILRHRQGFIFLKYPILFKLNSALAPLDNDSLQKFMKNVEDNLKEHKETGPLSKKLQALILSKNLSIETIKNQLLMMLADGYSELQKPDDVSNLTDLLDKSLKSLYTAPMDVPTPPPSYFQQTAIDIIETVKKSLTDLKIPTEPLGNSLINDLQKSLLKLGPKEFTKEYYPLIEYYPIPLNIVKQEEVLLHNTPNAIVSLFAMKMKNRKLQAYLARNASDDTPILSENRSTTFKRRRNSEDDAVFSSAAKAKKPPPSI